MKSFSLIVLPLLVLCGSSSKAQTALSSTTSSETLQYTVSNSSGFTIKNNGTLDYDNSLNTLKKPSTNNFSAAMEVNGNIYNPPDHLIDSATKNDNKHNTLNSKLIEAKMSSKKKSGRVSLSYTTTVPSVTSIKLRDSFETREYVDSQSISIFPSAFPSVF